jgi:hypothetical protein
MSLYQCLKHVTFRALSSHAQHRAGGLTPPEANHDKYKSGAKLLRFRPRPAIAIRRSLNAARRLQNKSPGARTSGLMVEL